MVKHLKFDVNNPDFWHTIGLKLLDLDAVEMSINAQHREFISSYGCNWEVCCDVWTRISERFDEKEKKQANLNIFFGV